VLSLETLHNENTAQKILLANERFGKVTQATNDAIWDWDIINHTFYRSKAAVGFFGKCSPLIDKIDFCKTAFIQRIFPKLSLA
jgi:hypothetical protein